ncbi:LacI family DNA-binding transcriptional regulator [Planococcus sp. APC 4015]|nr:LacI family DNA-binding transcriptional regulator [Planococcus sp. APC 4015]
MPHVPRGRPTLSDVADAAGLSVSSVSRALAGRGDLAPATRARVIAEARRLGYARTDEPRGRPRGGTARLFDLVLGHFHDPYSDEVTAGARSAAAQAGYDLVLTAERDHPDDDWPARIRARGSAGAVLGLVVPTATQLALLRDASVPVVLLDPRAEHTPDLPSVQTTDRVGGASAAAHLVGAGATRFLVVVGTPAYRFGRARVAGFVDAVDERMPGASVQRIDTEWNGGDARAACRAAIESLPPGERLGVFATSDTLATMVYAGAADAGRMIPRDVLVVGFDDVRGARSLQPALTTVRQPIREMAAHAIGLLARAVAGDPLPGGPVSLATSLIVRGSTAAVPHPPEHDPLHAVAGTVNGAADAGPKAHRGVMEESS